MKKSLYLMVGMFMACAQHPNEIQEQTTPSENSPQTEAWTFQKKTGTALLIGKKITLLDANLATKAPLKEGSIIEVVGVSDRLFQPTEDYCESFRYVKIKTDSLQGLIDGRNVYQISPSDQDTSFSYGDQNYQLRTTSFFGIGFSDADGLTFCSTYYEPVVLRNSSSQTPRLIELIENDISKDASWNAGLGYLELMANDAAYDQIIKMEPSETGIILTIQREFQEGWIVYKVQLHITENRYQAEYQSYGEIQY